MPTTDPATPARKLVLLRISPFSERARWALDHHKVPYQPIDHMPILGEKRLRRLVGPDKPRATVPVLILPDGALLTDSWDIALHADRAGSGTRLIPEGKEAEIRTWNDRADAVMATGRALVAEGMQRSPGALDESLPRALPAFLKPLLRPVGRYAMGQFGRKYGVQAEDLPVRLARMRAPLVQLREALSISGEYVLGTFSYADIVMATCLQGLAPVADRFIRLGPETRKVWTQPALAGEFPDLVAWRDRLYEKHRG